jgi:hypothetical protein
MKNITPVIKRSRTKTEEYEVCPHCNEEIMEKSSFIDGENYIYHRPCFEKGPIGKIKSLSSEELREKLGW